MTLPASLQALKDQTRNVIQEKEDITEQESAAWWSALLTVAKESLGPLWEFVTKKDRPHHFTGRTASHGFDISIPGHRDICAHFHVLNSGRAFWTRGHFSGSTLDVEDGRSLWMVSPRPIKNHLPTYFQTLGAALVAAEMR